MLGNRFPGGVRPHSAIPIGMSAVWPFPACLLPNPLFAHQIPPPSALRRLCSSRKFYCQLNWSGPFGAVQDGLV